MKFSNQDGQGLIEYLIIVALMGVATISILSVVGSSMSRKFAGIANAIQGDPQDVGKVEVNEGQYKRKDLGDFLKGAVVR